MAVGLGGGGAIGLARETTYGTWVTPAVWVPVLEESLMYTEDRYYSQAIRQQALDNETAPGYYHIEGDITFEVDTRYLPYFLGASRLTEVKTGAGPYVYTYTPNGSAAGAGSAFTKSLSITVIRNSVNFAYSGCVCQGWSFNIDDDGVLKMTVHVLGTTEATQSGSPTWVAPSILGAGIPQLTTGAGSASAGPTLTADLNFKNFTFEANDNGEVQNRIGTTPSRSASYIAFGKGEYQCSADLDFIDKTAFGEYKSATKKAWKLLATGLRTGTPATNDQVALTVFNSPYDSYQVALGDMGTIVTASSVLHVLSSGGTNPPFNVVVNSDANIT